MSDNIFVDQFREFPLELQRAIISNLGSEGVNPFGSRLVVDSRIHLIRYKSGSYVRNQKDDFVSAPNMTWTVGQKIPIPDDNGKWNNLEAEITSIQFDWLTSFELKTPIYAIKGRRTDGYGPEYIIRYISVTEFEIVCEPPRPVRVEE